MPSLLLIKAINCAETPCPLYAHLMNHAKGILPISAKKSITIAKHTHVFEEDSPQCAIHTEKVTSFFNLNFFAFLGIRRCTAECPTAECPTAVSGITAFLVSHFQSQLLIRCFDYLTSHQKLGLTIAYLKHVPRVAGTNSSTALPTLSELSRNSKLTVKNSELDT